MIKTSIQCQNIAPIENLMKEIASNSLKMGVFANNGSGKTFISRLFRLTECTNVLQLDEEGKSPTDKLITLGKNRGNFSFSIRDKDGNLKEDFKIQVDRGSIPVIPKTEYLYHTFNQDYVDDNIRKLSYEKDGKIEGFILGKINIDLKDDEDKLAIIKKDGAELSEQVKKEIETYIEKNISNIQNIKKLNEFKILETQNIINGIDKERFKITRSFIELIDDYNKVKSVPENLNDILTIEKLNIDIKFINDIGIECKKTFSLSSLADEFKNKIKEKQNFIEKGIDLIQNSNEKGVCPFCEQKFEENALKLIDKYTKYLNDIEAVKIKLFKSYTDVLEKYLVMVRNIETKNIKTINDFNIYKSKYIPSCKDVELSELDTIKINGEIGFLITTINEKIKNISIPIEIDLEIIHSIEKNQTLINGLIDKNNQKVKEINVKKNQVGEESKAIRRDICKCAYNYLVDQHKTNIKNLDKLRKEWIDLNEQIKKKKEQQKVSKRIRVASTIKVVLNYFFAGKYTLDEETFRLIFHSNVLNKNQTKDILSDGEKNIVAFAYYIGDTHLKIENEDDYEKLFFVIDDPISSMDFTHVYTLCGVIRDIGKIIDKLKMDRLLIFTHNNDFMRVITTNNIVNKKMHLKNNSLEDFNNNFTVPYIEHLMDIYNIAHKGFNPSHTTANSIRHIIETLTKFEKIDISTDSIVDYIRENFPDDCKSYTLINDLSHGGWRTEQAPITDDDYKLICKAIIKHIDIKYKGQVEYCKKTKGV